MILKLEEENGQATSYGWKMKGSQKRFLMGNFIIQDQWENQEQDGRASSRGAHHRS